MKQSLLAWAHRLQSALLSYGVWGLVGVAFIDSAFVPLPQAVDVLVITLSAAEPQNVVWYALAAMAGSLAGCLVLYYLARAGGRVFLEKNVDPGRFERIHAWFDRYEFLTIMVSSILPPPTPLKAFVVMAGALRVNVAKFALAIFLGRSVRYLGEGWLAVRYGHAVWEAMKQHGLTVALVVVLCVLCVLLWKRAQRGAAANR